MTTSSITQTVLITGAAGNLGQAVAQAFEGSQTRLILVGRDRARLEQLYGASSAHKTLVAVDLTRRADVLEGLREVAQGPHSVDVVCHIAGGFAMGQKLHELPEADWDQMQDMNTRSLLNIAACVVPGMIAKQSGKLVAVGANSAQRGLAGMGAYICSKNSVLRIVETMSAELKDQGINVNAVLPGILDTPENRAAMPDADPSKWVALPALAQVIAFLASDAASAIHGVGLPVTGRG